jgi:hypothetical protein
VLRLFFLQHSFIDSSQAGVLGVDFQEPNAKKVPAIAAASMVILKKFFLMMLVSDAFDETIDLNVTANLNLIF